MFSLQFRDLQFITAVAAAVEIDIVARLHQEVQAGVGLVRGRRMRRDQTRPWLERMVLVAGRAVEQTSQRAQQEVLELL